MRDSAVDTGVVLANKAIAAGASAAVVGGLTANEIAAFGGLLVAVLGLIVQLVFKLLDNSRKAQIHKLRLSGAKFPDDEDDDG